MRMRLRQQNHLQEGVQMKAVGYIRVSSEMQIETVLGLDAQCTIITDYVRAKGWTLSAVFCDPRL